MTKKSFILPIVGFMSIGLAGCANNGEIGESDPNNDLVQPLSYNDEENVNNFDARTEPFGYYSNEDHHNNGNVRILDDNDGPITEMMDHNFGAEGTNEQNRRNRILQAKDKNGNPENPTKPLGKTDLNYFQRDNRFSTSDVNYHGHLDANNSRVRSANNTAYDIRLADKLDHAAASVVNVEDVHSIVYKNSVIIAVDLKDTKNEAQVREQVGKAVQPYLNGKTVNVISDEGTFTRIRDIDYRLRHNDFRDGFDTNIRDIFEGVNNQNR